ncbi:GNAT family N-acetyltransferase [Kitasatospora nipponensis]|uniref:GNAT family N-acetyltransferase n=1 Tax=Kitasatospora nipponensis TaxID=258049 RepID=A0ABN1VM78_9ACTN
MTIRTERLTLLPLRAEHAAEMAEVLGDPALHTFIGDAPLTAEQLRVRYQRWEAGSPDPAETWCNWVVRLDGDPARPGGEVRPGGEARPGDDEGREDGAGPLVGWVQATLAGGEAEIAWVVGTGWQGRGIAKEAARAVAGHLAGLRVVAHVHPDHAAAGGVAAAAGLAPTERWQDGERRWEREPLGECAPAHSGPLRP